MPVYRDSLEITNGSRTTKLLLFDYMKPADDVTTSKHIRRLISLEPCLTVGTKNFTTLSKEEQTKVLQKGLFYNGYYIRTINGPYDYCYKLWIDRRLPFAPSNARVPPENEPQEAVIIDENQGYFGIACGPHVAFCSLEALRKAGYSIEKKKLPIVIKVKLRRSKENRSTQIPYAAFEAIPVEESEEDQEETKQGQDKIADST